MRLIELADTMRVQIEILHRNNWQKPESVWYAKFNGVEVKDGPMLRGVFGNGSTPHEALRNYVEEIKGKELVHKGNTPTARYFNAPISLSL